MSDDQGDGMNLELPESLLPYDEWVEDAYRTVMLRALEHASVSGLPGEHHFYLTFLTNHSKVVIPDRLRAQYPQEMTIVIQHQFWDLKVDHDARTISVGLSFGGVGSVLVISFDCVTAFADPHIRMALRFTPILEENLDEEDTGLHESEESPHDPPPAADGQVVSLDAFRKRPKN